MVEVLTGSAVVRHFEGDFFGEMALLSQEPRSATVTAVRAADLLVLDAVDFLRLIDRIPAIRDHVEAVTEGRRHGDAGRS